MWKHILTSASKFLLSPSRMTREPNKNAFTVALLDWRRVMDWMGLCQMGVLNSPQLKDAGDFLKTESKAINRA